MEVKVYGGETVDLKPIELELEVGEVNEIVSAGLTGALMILIGSRPGIDREVNGSLEDLIETNDGSRGDDVLKEELDDAPFSPSNDEQTNDDFLG